MEERLQSLIGYLGLTGGKFAETIGVQKSSISHILSGRNKPSFEFISRILSAYREISPDWLILGEGEMIRGEQVHRDQNNNMFTNVNKEKGVEKIILVYDDKSFEILHEAVQHK